MEVNITKDDIQKFMESAEAVSMDNLDYTNKLRDMRQQLQDQNEELTEPVEQVTEPEVQGDTRPVSARGEGRAAFQTSKEFGTDYTPGPNEEEAARALASGVLSTLDSIAGIPDIPARLRGEEVPNRFSEAFDIDPIELDTKWGPFLESTVHYGSLGVGIMGALAASPFSLPTIGGGTTAASKVGTGILQGAMIGVGQDAISIRSHEQNASRMLIDRFAPLTSILGPLATKDSDSPLAIYLKNILEGIGFEAALGGTWELLGQGLSKAKRAKLKTKVKDSALNKLEDRYKQTKEKGKAEFDEQEQFLRTISDLEQRQLGGEVIDMDNLPPSPYIGVRGHKNSPITESWQGTPNSRSTPYDNHRNLNLIDSEEPYGSVDSIMSALEAEDFATDGISKSFINRIKNELINDDRFKELIAKGKAKGRSTYSMFRQTFKRYQDLIGRDVKNPKEFWKGFLKDTDMSVEDLLTHELITNSLFKQIRDVATAAKEIKRIGGNIFDTDGPMKTIADRMVTAFDLLNYNRAVSRSNVKNGDKLLSKIHEDNLNGTNLLMQFLDGDAGEELVEEVLKFLSTSHRSGKMSDFNNWMRQKMTGGEMLPGKNKQGALLQELHQIHINSFFGPKTAQRAIWGTGINSYLTQFHDTFGAALRYPVTRDTKQFKSQFASFASMFEFLPDAFKIFKGRLGESFKPDAVIDTRFTEYGRRQFNSTAYKEWLDRQGSESDKIVFNMWETARHLNGDSLLGRAHSGISRIMDAADKTFEELIRHRRVKEISMRDALMAQEKGDISEITSELLDAAGQLYEQKYYNEFGDIDLKREAFTKNDFDEVTYRTELQGMSKAFAEFVEQVPFIKPFHRFIRSGVNGLTVKTQNMPLLAGIVKKERAIALANPDDLSGVLQFGIDNAWDLEKAKARQWSRQAFGYGLVYLAAQKYLLGGLSGNGPANVGMRNVMQDTGWERNMIEIWDKRVSLEVLEPWDLLLKGVADIGDNMSLMGPEWAEDKLRAFAIVTAFSEAATNQTFLQSAGDLIDVLRGEPGSESRLIRNIANFVPFGNWRRVIGDTITNPYREINSSIWSDKGLLESGAIQAIRKDNLLSEGLTDDPLPLKYNLLNGKEFKGTNVLGRLFRATSMVAIEPGASPGQKLLWRSNYDLRVSTWYSPGPDNISLKDEPYLRSEFAKQMGLVKIGGQNLEQWLESLANDPKIKASVQEMIEDKRKGDNDYNPIKSYYHNKIIKQRFERVRKQAWAIVRTMPEAKTAIQAKLDLERKQRAKLHKTTHQELLLPTR